MATLNIQVFASLGVDNKNNSTMPQCPPLQGEALTFTAVTPSNLTFTGNMVRLLASAGCFVKFGAAPTATLDDIELVADVPEWFAVIPGHTLSVWDGSTETP